METGWHSCKKHSISVTLAINLRKGNSGPIVFLGGLLLLITSILEFILGNTFPCVVFGTIGEFEDIEECTAAS